MTSRFTFKRKDYIHKKLILKTWKFTTISRTFHTPNGHLRTMWWHVRQIHIVTLETWRTARIWRGCWREDPLVSPCSSICKTRGSKVNNMHTSCKIKTDIVRFLVLGNMTKSSTQRVFTSIHKTVYCTLLRELPLVLTLASQGWASGSASSGRRWILPLTCPRKTHWSHTSSPALWNVKSSSRVASMTDPFIVCTP